jgi:hypothetical protein
LAQTQKFSPLFSIEFEMQRANLARLLEVCMNEVAEKEVLAPEVLDARTQLGQWMGRREAFGLMAGRCTAADIEILRRMRDEKMYAQMNCTWSEFCSRHLHVARRTVDREIGHLREFGPAFFAVRQLTHVAPKDYRSIAPYITEQGVNMDGKMVPLLPDNSEPLTAAVEQLLQRIESANPKAAAMSFGAMLKRCRAAGRALRSFEERLDAEQIKALATELVEIRNAGESLGARYIEVNLELQ